MKNLIIACLSLFLGLLAVDASAQNERSRSVEMPEQSPMERTRSPMQDKEKTSINVNQLPAAVRTALSSDRYNSWEVSEAWKITKDGKTFYQVKSTRGNDTETFKFDEKGQLVDDKPNKKRQ